MTEREETAPSPVEALVTAALEALESGGEQALELMLAEHPERAADVRQRLRWLVDIGLAASSTEPNAPPQRLGDFELFEPLGQGGMGVVYRARQRSLGREVALKLVRPEQLLFPGQRERFRREIEVVANLAHPGIVPIYAVGEELGTPYFAMERVRGASLAQVLDTLRFKPPAERTGADFAAALERLGADPREPTSQLFDGAWPQVCMRILREAAEALEHAHRRGVVHRDVKPSNLMVTRGGRVLCLDFGLASDIDSQIAPAQQRLTRTGLRVGTLAYMSPEQLRGERRVDPRSDVFALGVTLYELLSGRLPVDETTQARRTDGSGVGVPRDLRKRDPRIPRELETVVQTATALDPAERYASAADFAHDLGAVLDGRAIEARAASPTRLVALWVRRHPGWALAGALALAAPSLIAWRENRALKVIAEKNRAIERSSTELQVALAQVTEQRDAVESERARAERNLERAHEAVERMLSRVGGEVLSITPRVDAVRQGLLEDALELEEQLLAEPAVTRDQRIAHAATLRRSASIRGELGEYETALELFARQARVLDELLAERDELQLALQRAENHKRVAEARKLRGELDAARLEAEFALTRFQALRERAPDNAALVHAHARARLELADILAQLSVNEGRTELLTGVVDDLAPFADATWEVRLDLAHAYDRLGASPHALVGLVSTVRDPEEDVRWLRKALDAYEELARERPEHPACARRFAQTRVELALRLMQLRDLGGAAAQYQAAIESFEQLARDFRAHPVYADALASALYNRSLIAAMLRDAPLRMASLQRAAEVFDELAGRVELSPVQRRSRALVWVQLGDALGAKRSGCEALERALELGDPLLAEDRNGSLRRALAWTASRLAGFELSLGALDAAVVAAERLRDYAPGALDTLYAAEWLAQCSGEVGADAAERVHWRERSLALVEEVAARSQLDTPTRDEFLDCTLDALRDEPRFRAVLAALEARR